MQYFNHLDVSIYQIKMFLNVAELGSFSKAALAMNVEQSTLSKRIASLEQIMGTPLFMRTARPVTLTEEGRALFLAWKRLVYDFERSIEDVFALHRERSHRLLVCTVDSINTVSTMPWMRTQMLQKHKELDLSFEYVPFSRWRDKLAGAEMDLVLTVSFESAQLRDVFCSELVWNIPKSVCMLKTNPLSRKGHITFDDLKTQSFILVSPLESPAYAEFVKQLCRANGFEPRVSKYIDSAHGLFSSLQHSNEVVICDSLFRDFDNPLMATFDLPETHSGLLAVWNTYNTNPYLRSFLDTLKHAPPFGVAPEQA